MNHRFSDDIDLFAYDDKDFCLWAERVIQAISGATIGDINSFLRFQGITNAELCIIPD